MKQTLKRSRLLVLIMILSMVLPAMVYSQPTAPDDADTPIDGGISLVLATAGIVGAKKMRDSRKKNKG